jgi:hypothetical protein
MNPTAPPASQPAPANPSGTYAGTFQIVTIGTQVNRRLSDNGIALSCTFDVVINGTLSLRIFNVLTNGMVQSELTSSWTETGAARPATTCPMNASWGTIAPPAGVAGFEGPPSAIVVARADRTTGSNGISTLTRAESFVGAVSGDTVVMQVSRSFEFANQLNTAINGLVSSVLGYPTASVATTLVKQ